MDCEGEVKDESNEFIEDYDQNLNEDRVDVFYDAVSTQQGTKNFGGDTVDEDFGDATEKIGTELEINRNIADGSIEKKIVSESRDCPEISGEGSSALETGENSRKLEEGVSECSKDGACGTLDKNAVQVEECSHTTVHSDKRIRDDNVSESESGRTKVKIVVFGKDGTGKTALIVRLLTRRFIHEYDPTSEDIYSHHSVIDGEEVVLKIMDTAGMMERNIHEREKQIQWGDGFLLVLSLTNLESLKVLHLIKALIEEVCASQKPMVLVANKSDLQHAREVSTAEIEDVAEKWKCPLFETAATEDYSVVEKPFTHICAEILNQRKATTGSSPSEQMDNAAVISDLNSHFCQKLLENSCNTEHTSESTPEIV